MSLTFCAIYKLLYDDPFFEETGKENKLEMRLARYERKIICPTNFSVHAIIKFRP